MPANILLVIIAFLASPVINPSSPAIKKKTVATVHILRGFILQISPQTALFRTASGIQEEAIITQDTRFWKDKRSSEIGAFPKGMQVTAHLRLIRSHRRPEVTDMADTVSWKWLVILHRQLTRAALVSVSDSSLKVKPEGDSGSFDYRINDKTLWGKSNVQVESNPFLPGDAIWIAPRSLPDGEALAKVVADSNSLAILLKGRLASSLHGKITQIDASGKSFTIHTVSGDTRVLKCADTIQIRRGRSSLEWKSLQPGENVLVRLHKNPVSGEREVWRITVVIRKSAKIRGMIVKPPLANGK